MRTLKKSLCLVLALVFVLGLCTIGTNAAYAKYTDLAEISYDEAVEVLTGLGVVEGYPDGTFNPTANVTRAEAAAMITRMMLGREDADKLPVGDVKFSDVPETNWAAKYIAFCANKGIIVGMGDGTFRPSDNVTGTQMATMLLRALGYGVIGEYEGKGWDINAVADALYYGVFADSKVKDFNNAATREENALYVWNTMWIRLVGYDVDRNYYDNKGITFARQAFNLFKTEYSRANPTQVLANQATGDTYTKIRTYDYDRGALVTLNMNIETGLDLIGHDVTVYYKGGEKRDAANHCYYYECYLVKDESTVIAPLSGFSSLDDLYRALKAANSDNVDRAFGGIPKWVNYDYTSNLHVAPVTDFDSFGRYYQVEDLKGQRSSMDNLAWMLVGGNWILDRDGIILCVTSTAYQVGQVKNVDTVHDEVAVNVWVIDNYVRNPDTGDRFYKEDYYYVDEDGDYAFISAPTGYETVDSSHFEEEIVEFKKNGIEQTFEGIAKNDLVVVQPTGSLIKLSPTDTVTEEITERASSMGSWTFNGTYSKDNSAFGIPVEDEDDPASVEVGDVVKFYIIKGAFSTTYFGLSIVEKANSGGTVFLNFATVVREHTDWETENIIKVQTITEDGKEAVYKMTETAFARVGGILNADGDAVVDYNRGAYKASLRKNGYVVLTAPEGDLVRFDKVKGRNSYLMGEDGTYYYVTSDTKVVYFTGDADDLDITTISKLSDRTADPDRYTVWAVSKRSGGTWKLSTVWVNHSAPSTKDKVMYVGYSKYSYSNDPTGYDALGVYYTAFIDGKAVTKVHLTGEDYIYYSGESINAGFYNYEIDEDGYYVIEPVAAGKAETFVQLNKNSIKRDGSTYRLYTATSDGVDITNIGIVDATNSATTKGTKSDATITSVERLYELLRDGYTILASYLYEETSSGNRIPQKYIYAWSVDSSGAAD